MAKFPTELTELSNPLEGYIVGLFWKHPELYLDYDDSKISKNTFVNDYWYYYFSLGRFLKINENKTVLDDIATELALSKFEEKTRNQYYEYDGYEPIAELLSEVDIENFDGYYDELKKWELLRQLYGKEFPVIKNIDKFKKMNYQQIIDYWEYQLNDIIIKSDTSIKIYNLFDDLEVNIKQANEKPSVGLPFLNMPLFNAEFHGIAKGCLYELGMLSGFGKTTVCCASVITSAIKHKEKIGIIANEQGILDYQQTMISTILKQNFNYNFNRNRFLQGKFTKEEWDYLNQAIEYLDDVKKQGIIQFLPLEKQNMDLVNRAVKKMALTGTNYFILDTFKNDADGDWKNMMDKAMELYDIIKPKENGGLNVGLLLTTQLAKSATFKRYLEMSDIGISKNIVDVATTVMLARKIRDDERNYGKHPLEVWIYDENGEKTTIYLDDNKMYYILFIVKNRRGISDGVKHVIEVDLSVGYFKQVGVCKIPYMD